MTFFPYVKIPTVEVPPKPEPERDENGMTLGDRLRAKGCPGVKIPHHLKGDCSDYRSDLARFPNDPEAFVDGPRAVKKLWDKRQRQGWRRKEGGWDEALNKVPKLKDPEQQVREAYERARAKNFTPDSEGE